jgi:choice-of-anchor A domain-containing protein
VNVFTLNGSTFSGDTININAPAGSTVIVNVSGTSDSFTGGSINMNGVSESNVIFNFSQANSVSIANMSFNATLLAPLANFNGGGGQLNGQLIVNNAAGTTEFHNVLFSGTLPGGGVSATPEPSTWLMVLGGIGAVVFSNRRRLSASRA